MRYILGHHDLMMRFCIDWDRIVTLQLLNKTIIFSVDLFMSINIGTTSLPQELQESLLVRTIGNG